MPSVVFPYGVSLRKDGAIATFPAAEVWFSMPNGDWLSLLLLVDSGATISALPVSDAPVLGLAARSGVPMVIGGIVGKPIRAWRHEIPARLGREYFRLPIALLENPAAPRMLGRDGIFDRATVIFEELFRRSGFVRKNTREARTVHRILNQLSTRK